MIGAVPPKLEDVSRINEPLEIIFKSPADVDDVCNDREPANKSILSAAASWISAVVLVAPLDSCRDDAPALINIPAADPKTSSVLSGVEVPMPTLPSP